MQTELNFSAKDKGIQQAVDHADAVYPSWSEKAYKFLTDFIDKNACSFMAEDVRMESAAVIPEPPSKRAWGAIILRAAKSGLIRKVGYQKVTNAKAHATPASVWQRIHLT